MRPPRLAGDAAPTAIGRGPRECKNNTHGESVRPRTRERERELASRDSDKGVERYAETRWSPLSVFWFRWCGGVRTQDLGY